MYHPIQSSKFENRFSRSTIYIHWINYYPLGKPIALSSRRRFIVCSLLSSFWRKEFFSFFRYTGNGELESKQVKTSQKPTSIGNQQKVTSNTYLLDEFRLLRDWHWHLLNNWGKTGQLSRDVIGRLQLSRDVIGNKIRNFTGSFRSICVPS